ncbi:MAG TPA: DUF885 domain-containing protein [Chloroflexia bacterium]|nr:DUF885 domain-containing protein [Chloroflexia bacterium]
MSQDSARLSSLIARFLDAYNAFYPHNASFLLGIHDYDGRVPDFSAESVQHWKQQLEQFLSELRSIEYNALEKLEKFDYKVVECQLEFESLRHGSLRFYERNPIMPYLYIFDVSNYLKRNYAPLEQRVEALCRHLEATPRLLDQLQTLLDRTLPRATVEIALEAFGGFATYYNGDLARVEGLKDPALQERLEKAASAAGAALNRYVEFFKQHLEKADENYAIGPENYRELLKWGDMVDMPLEEVLRVGLEDMKRNQAGVREACARIDPGRPVEEVIKSVGAEHPANDAIVSTTLKYLDGIRQHLIEANVVDVPTNVRCIVEETPPFMRWIFADMETPGPFETVATEAHFYITPANEEWPKEQQEDWLSRFNDYTIQVFSMHEAYPGHYLQHIHARTSPSRAAKNLSSYTFVEGWAHYCEQMMLEEGYGREDPLVQAKLQLAQYQEALVRNCRYICSLGLHTQGWTLDQALKFYQENAWMEEITAKREAHRSTFDPGGLNYTLGKLLFYKLRSDYAAEKGDAFSLKEFHNQCLAYGMPPVPLLRLLLLEHDDGKVLA